MTTGGNESKTLKTICHENMNVNLLVEIVIQIKSGITTKVDAIAENIKDVENIIF